MVNECFYWQIQHKENPTRNVWVSGVSGLCPTPEKAIGLAIYCKEIAEEDRNNWTIIQLATLEEWQARHGAVLKRDHASFATKR